MSATIGATSSETIRTRIDASRMSRYQWLIVVVCIALNAQDGYDIAAASFSANGISQEWGVSGAALGGMISAGLVGIVLGAFALSPLADRFGRKPITLFGLALTAAGMSMAALAPTIESLIVWRVITGVGIGGVTACINVIAAEYTNPKWRAMSIALYTAGFGVGAAAGGAVAAVIATAFDWRAIFVVGAINSVVSLVVVALVLPESIEFRYRQHQDGKARLDRINSTLRKINQPEISGTNKPTLAVVKTDSTAGKIGVLFSTGYLKRTLLLWVSFLCVAFAFYFASGWVPRMGVLAGNSEEVAALAGSSLAIGSALGALFFGIASMRFRVTRVLMIFGASGTGTLILLGFLIGTPYIFCAIAFFAGFFTMGAFVGFFTLAPNLYPPTVRATGVGWMNGVGRTGAILAPITAGVLVDLQWGISTIFTICGLTMVAMSFILYFYKTSDPRM